MIPFSTMARPACRPCVASISGALLVALLGAVGGTGCSRGSRVLFEQVQELRILAEPRAVQASDIDGDGFLDVVVGSDSGTPIALRFNLGDGGLGPALRLRLETSEPVLDVGALDRASRGPTLAVLLASGVALLTDPDGLGFSVPAGGRVARCVDCASFVAGDYNGDGESDLLVVGAKLTELYPGPGLQVANAPRPPRLLASPRPRLADLDRDGADDLIAVRDLGAGPEGVILSGAASGVFGAIPLPAGLEQATAVAAAEVDGDGLLDLVQVAPARLGVVLAGSGDYAQSFSVEVPGLDPTALEVLDANGDGLDDLAVGDRAGRVLVFVGANGGRFLQAPTLELGATPVAMHHGDLDQDGKDELLVVTPTGEGPAALHVYRGGSLAEPPPELTIF